MAKDEWARRFVKENLAVLDSPTATGALVKKLRQGYFDRNALRSESRFSNGDVASIVGELLARKGFESVSDFSKAVSSVPFLKDELRQIDRDLLFARSAQAKPAHLSKDDLSKIREEKHLRRIEDQISAKVEGAALERVKEKTAQLETSWKAMEEEKRRLEGIRSTLEDWPHQMALPDLLAGIEKAPAISEGPMLQSWWEDVGLVADPFPSNQGLAEIPKEKYEAVVVQTSFFKYYMDAVRHSPAHLVGKTNLVIGEFGSGKTTLFQYMTGSLGAVGILPVMCILNPHPNVASLTTKMLEQMRIALAPVVADRLGRDPRRDGHTADPESDVLGILRELQESGTEGFVVFVDGLHKGTTYTEQVLEFLQQIQNVQELFTQRGIRLGFIIAGSPVWEDQLARRPSLSGSFYRKASIPPLSEDLAIEAVDRRLKAFAKDPAHHVGIRRDSLRKAFQVLGGRLARNLTFRDFLDHVRIRFEARAFDELGLVVRLHFETVEVVHNALATTPLGPRRVALIQACQGEQSLISACRTSLLEILAKTYIDERSGFFSAHRAAFWLLFRNGFIAKRKGTHGGVVWTLSEEAYATIIGISKKSAIAPDDVVLCYFEEPGLVQVREEKTVVSPLIEVLGRLSVAWTDNWKELSQLLVQAQAKLRDLEKTAHQPSHSLSRTPLIEPLEYLADGLNWLVYDAVASETRWTQFEAAWCAPENSAEVVRFVKESTPLKDQTAYFGALHEMNRIASSLVELMESLVRGEGLVRLRKRSLAVEELSTLHELRGLYSQQAYREVSERIAGLFEDRIRNTLYPVMRAVWGPHAIDRLPSDIRTKIQNAGERGHPRARRPKDENFLYDVSRSEYTKIIFESSIYKCALAPLLDSSRKQEAKDKLELAFSLNDRTAHRDRAAYFRDHATEIADVLRYAPKVLELFHQASAQLLIKSEFAFETPHDGSISARFLPNTTLTPPSSPIRVSKKDAASITKELLTMFSIRSIEVRSLDDLLLAGSMAPEIQLSMVRVNLKYGYLRLESAPFAPLTAILTEEGHQQLARFSTSGQTALPA